MRQGAAFTCAGLFPGLSGWSKRSQCEHDSGLSGLKLFLAFLAGSSGKPAAQLRLEALRAEQVLAFLENVEQKRNNCTCDTEPPPGSVADLLSVHDLRRHRSVWAVSENRGAPKWNPRPIMGYPDIGEVQAILDSIDRDGSTGSRDYALFSSQARQGAP